MTKAEEIARAASNDLVDWLAEQQYQGEPLLHVIVCCDFVSRQRLVDSVARQVAAALEKFGAEERAEAVQTQRMVGQLEHYINCPERNPMSEDFCTCGLIYRRYLQTEQTISAAWKKRAEEAEAALEGIAVRIREGRKEEDQNG